MTILALEFSSPQRSVAVLPPAGKVAGEAVETGGRGTNAFRMIEQVLDEAKIEREQVEAIAVGLGPGSYTGVRAAISLAQGWQVAREVKLLGIRSADAIAAQAQAENVRGRVSVVIDAQRNELYLATYAIGADGWRETGPLEILSPADVQTRAGAEGILAGPEVTRWFPGGRRVFPRAAALAELAAHRRDFPPADKLEPVYLRETNFVKSSSRRSGAGQGT